MDYNKHCLFDIETLYKLCELLFRYEWIKDSGSSQIGLYAEKRERDILQRFDMHAILTQIIIVPKIIEPQQKILNILMCAANIWTLN